MFTYIFNITKQNVIALLDNKDYNGVKMTTRDSCMKNRLVDIIKVIRS